MAPPLTSVAVSDLCQEFQPVLELSPDGFAAVVDLLDQNADHFIDDSELFDIFGVELSCSEWMEMLGIAAYSHLTPQTLYFGECPPFNRPLEPEPDVCSNTDGEVTEEDAQVALDFLMSLSFYLRSNRDVISGLERDSLFFQCTPDVPDRSEEKDFSRKQFNVPKEEKNFKIAEEARIRVQEALDEFISDQTAVDYYAKLCREARIMDPDNVRGAALLIMNRDSLAGTNPLDDYPEDIFLCK